MFIGLLFIFSGLAKLFPVSLFEGHLVYQGITDWQWAPLLARIIIILELWSGVLLLGGLWLKKIVIPATMLLLTFFSVQLIYSIFTNGNQGNCGCFGTILPMRPSDALTKNLVIILLLYLLHLLPVSSIAIKKFTFSYFLSTGIVLTTAVSVFFPDYHFTNSHSGTESPMPFEFTGSFTFSDNSTHTFSNGHYLLVVLNTSCAHCKEVGLKLSVIGKKKKLPDTRYFLIGEKKHLANFLAETHIKNPYKLFSFVDFVSRYRNATWPRIIEIMDGKITKQWVYSTFDVQNFQDEFI